MISNETPFFIGFNVVILLLLFLDLKVIGKKNHVIKMKEALLWSAFWIIIAISFYYVIRWHGEWIHGISNIDDITYKIEKYGQPVNIEGLNYEQALDVYNKNLSLEYITGYVIEKSLSVDNLFVMIMIFFAFGVQRKYYKRVLFWGILGALVMRFIFIFGSAVLIQQFEWMLYLFGALLVYTGVKMFIDRNKDEKNIDVAKHPVVKFSSKYLRVYPKYVGNRFFIKGRNRKFYFTPLFIVVLVIEFSDVIFATDSIPAIFSITKDPYIVYFSNIFAILGLRSLFFLLLNVINVFHYLKHGLSFLLTFIGFKLIFNEWLKDIGFTTAYSLYVILATLVISIAVSLLFPKKEEKN
jgi:tellurite resistance protein TerC